MKWNRIGNIKGVKKSIGFYTYELMTWQPAYATRDKLRMSLWRVIDMNYPPEMPNIHAIG